MSSYAKHSPRGFFDARDVLDAARGRWETTLGRLGVNTALLTSRHGPCPGCGGRDRFRFDDKDGEGTFICSQGGGGNLAGNGLTLLAHVTGWQWKRCVEEVGRLYLSDSSRRFGGAADAESGESERSFHEPLPDAPRSEMESVPKFREERLRSFIEGMPDVTRDDLRAMSPVSLGAARPVDFFEALYDADERALVFTNFYSQGDFLYWVGRGGSYRLSQERGVKAVVSPLPTTAREGVWFLCNPVNGLWEPGEGGQKLERLPHGIPGPPQMVTVPAKWQRRSWRTVTSFRYAVLESDTVDEGRWLKVLMKLPVPIVAIYTSGGKSLHALVRIDARSKLEWDMMVRGKSPGLARRQTALMDLVCPLGADAAALTAVRLTRLPFCFREGTKPKNGPYRRYEKPALQELLYLSMVPLDRPMAWKSLEMKHGGKIGL